MGRSMPCPIPPRVYHGGAALLAALTMAASAGAVSPSGPRTIPGSRASTPSPYFLGDQPAVAAGADGTVAVAFSHLAPARRLDTPERIRDAFDRRTILVAVRRPRGRWLPTQTVSAPGAASPQVVVDARGRVLVVWLAPACSRRPRPAVCGGVLGGLHARALSSADRWGPIETLARNTTLGFEGPPRPSVALDARGAATIAYAGGRARKGPLGDFPIVSGSYAVRRSAGGRIGRPRLLPKLGGELVAAVDGAGHAYVAGTRAEPGDNAPAVYVSVRRRTGGWHTGSRVSAIPGSKPRIAVASDGEVVLAWIAARFESEHLEYGPVLAALANPGRRRFSAPRQISAQSHTRAVRIVAGGAGETLVSWSDSPEFGQPGRGLSYAVRRTGGHFGSPRTIPDANPGDAVDAGAVVMLRGGLGLWFSQPPFGRRGGLLAGAREAGGEFGASRAVASERWRGAAAASSPAIAAVAGPRERVLRIVTVRP
jgi:hypothetical protein